ncbi:MAG: GSCFA domain-containing protein [Sphingobacteriales bacterium]|nr:MAG: GSCFA domain-containing protein [Sphingobacteriales bacterium]
MEFRLEFTPKPFEQKINHQHKLFLAGSCFTEQIGSKLAAHKFRIIDNPNGILFNPVSIARSVISYIDDKIYTEADLFYNNELWGSWEHHTKFSSIDKNESLQLINESQKAAHRFLKEADWLLLTLGSAFVYELENNQVVANCHKVPTDKFKKRLLSVDEVITTLDTLIYRLKQFNPLLKIIFTISPVRHLRDGFVENNRSKATLINAVHHLVDKFDGLFYFPAYELIIDDLRDYRFFAEDMVHPNYAATNYVWEKFVAACIDEPSQLLMKEINIVNAAKNHKAFNPASAAHKKFLQTNLSKAKRIAAAHNYIDMSEEIKYFAT